MSSMPMNNILWISSAVVAGLLGAAGIFLISQIAVESRSHTVNENPDALRSQIVSLQKEVNALKELQKKVNQNKKKRNRTNAKNNSVSYASDTDSVDYRSVVDTDLDSDDEFFDASQESDDDLTLTEDLIDNQLIENVDTLLTNGTDGEVKEAYEILIKLNNSRKNITDKQLSEILWRLCRCCQRMINICEQNNDAGRKKDMIEEGLLHGKEALLYNYDNPNAHKWYAIIIGIRSKDKGTSEKIEDGNTYLHHIQEAIKLDPNDPVLYHLQGRFNYEIASLSWFEKKAAATIFGNMPVATYEETLANFKKAEDLIAKDWKENRLYLAKTYIGMKNYKEGVNWLKSAIEIPIMTTDDQLIDEESRELLVKYD